MQACEWHIVLCVIRDGQNIYKCINIYIYSVNEKEGLLPKNIYINTYERFVLFIHYMWCQFFFLLSAKKREKKEKWSNQCSKWNQTSEDSSLTLSQHCYSKLDQMIRILQPTVTFEKKKIIICEFERSGAFYLCLSKATDCNACHLYTTMYDVQLRLNRPARPVDPSDTSFPLFFPPLSTWQRLWRTSRFLHSRCRLWSFLRSWCMLVHFLLFSFLWKAVWCTLALLL